MEKFFLKKINELFTEILCESTFVHFKNSTSFKLSVGIMNS